jgi:hypothetical protein
MANSGYVSSSAINQIFTDGPYSGSFVSSSFSNTSNTVLGPIISFKQSFVSGSSAPSGSPGYDPNAINDIADCSPFYFTRISYNPTLCPTGECLSPTLTSIAVSNCTTYDYKYNITYNSASSNALYTKIQYSTTADFSSNVATSSYITNSNPTIPPININNLPLLPTNGDAMVYFRAFNSCSSAPAPYTSSYSNILSASCAIPAGGAYSPFTIKIVNNSRTVLNYSLNSGNVFSIQNGASSSFNFSTETATVNVHLIPKIFTATGDPSLFQVNGENFYEFKVTGSATTTYSSVIQTIIRPLMADNVYATITAPSAQTTNSTRSIINSTVTSNNLSLNSLTGRYTRFASDTLSSNLTELQLVVSRNTWTAGGLITFTINPEPTKYYLFDPPTPTGGGSCVLSGTQITLPNGSTTMVDNLNEGNKVLSPSIDTLPPANDFDVLHWAANKLIITKNTATVTRNIKSQVNEVYSINNGKLITTDTHSHLFKHNNSWGIKTTPFMMVGDYLSGINGEEILIESIEVFTGEFTVFNLDVEENDLYVANGILTHNPVIGLK